MRTLLFLSLVILACTKAEQPVPPTAPPSKTIRYLALGDSYTIGTAIGVDSSYSAQLCDSLNSTGDTVLYQVIARNGWTTMDLLKGMDSANIDSNFDVVTVLIGVNNQYQQLSLSNYAREFKQILSRAINLAKDQKNRILVLSIPDWGVSPAGSGNRPQIASEIDAFNARQKMICDSLDVDFVDITGLSRQALNDPRFIARDGLHFSREMQTLWMRRVYPHWELKFSGD